jgi:hypothetical protein
MTWVPDDKVFIKVGPGGKSLKVLMEGVLEETF